MAIVKRLDPSDRFEQNFGAVWSRVRRFPMIAAMCNPASVNPIAVDPVSFTKLLDSFKSSRWISEVPMDAKVFAYALELVCHRAGLPGFLPEEFVPQLKKHMSTLTVSDKIDAMDGVNFAFRQCFLWDIPDFLARYPRPGTLHLPDPAKPASGAKIKPKPRPGAKPKPVRKRLAKHKH